MNYENKSLWISIQAYRGKLKTIPDQESKDSNPLSDKVEEDNLRKRGAPKINRKNSKSVDNKENLQSLANPMNNSENSDGLSLPNNKTSKILRNRNINSPPKIKMISEEKNEIDSLREVRNLELFLKVLGEYETFSRVS